MDKILEATLIEKGISVEKYNEGYTQNETRFYNSDGSFGDAGRMFYLVNEFIINNNDSDSVVSNSLYSTEYSEFDILFARSVYEQLKLEV